MSDPGLPVECTSADGLEGVADALLRTIASDGRGRDLLWSAAPTALLDHARGSVAPPERVRGRAARPTIATWLAALATTRGSSLITVDDVLFAYEGANPQATLAPVIHSTAQARGVAPVVRAVRPALSLLMAGTRDLRPLRVALHQSLPAGVPPAVERALQAAVRARARAEVALDSIAPRLVVLASQHSTSSRALIQAARARHIPTAYLPPAPVANTYQSRDLPTDFAGLRGPREVEFYQSLGARGALSVVGNPQAHVIFPPHLNPEAAVIFAPRPQPVAEVREQVAAVDAAEPAVVVSPHPRMRHQQHYADLWPAHWVVHDGWTAELLRGDHPCVIQRSSGVAWEAMAHGVPVIELASPIAGDPSYLVIREPYARLCASNTDLPAAVAHARQSAANPLARQQLVAWAQEWCAVSGNESVARATEWIERCASTPSPGEPLLDYWVQPSGVT